MLYFIHKTMIYNKFILTTNTQQKHNKKLFVGKIRNNLNFCCGIVVFVSFSFTVN